MRYLRLSIIGLIIDLVVLFNIERVTFQEVRIQVLPPVYLVALLSVAAVIVFRPLRGMNILLALALWNALNLALSWMALAGRPLFGDPFTYLTIAEAVLLSITVLLAYQVACHLDEFERAVEHITLAPIGREIRPLEDSVDDIETELIRSRRYQHPLSLILAEPDASAIPVNPDRIVREIQDRMRQRYAAVLLGRTISEVLRRTDSVFERTLDGRFVILCPETGNEESHMLAVRIQALCQEKFGLGVRCSVSSFPDHALTLDDLMGEAEARLAGGGALPTFQVADPPSTTVNGNALRSAQ